MDHHSILLCSITFGSAYELYTAVTNATRSSTSASHSTGSSQNPAASEPTTDTNQAQAEAQAIAAQDARSARMGGKSMQEKRAEGEGKRRVLEEIAEARKPPQKW